MADVVITIETSVVSYQAWLRTSYIGMGLVEEGTPLIKTTELGPDQVDAFTNLIEESAREVLKLFLSRQGDATGVPFEITTTKVIYRFDEGTPVLNQAAAIKSDLAEDVKNAIYAYITLLWFQLKGNEEQIAWLTGVYSKLGTDIHGNLYRLHD